MLYNEFSLMDRNGLERLVRCLVVISSHELSKFEICEEPGHVEVSASWASLEVNKWPGLLVQQEDVPVVA